MVTNKIKEKFYSYLDEMLMGTKYIRLEDMHGKKIKGIKPQMAKLVKVGDAEYKLEPKVVWKLKRKIFYPTIVISDFKDSEFLYKKQIDTFFPEGSEAVLASIKIEIG